MQKNGYCKNLGLIGCDQTYGLVPIKPETQIALNLQKFFSRLKAKDISWGDPPDFCDALMKNNYVAAMKMHFSELLL